MLKETRTTRLVKSQDLNHHGTLFAGRIAEWFTETCFLAAVRYFGNAEDLVCVKLHGLTFVRPTLPGDALEIVAIPARTGTKSLTIGGNVYINEDPRPAVHGFATFVSVDSEGKPYAHGLSLPADWIAAHREVCEEAERQQSTR